MNLKNFLLFFLLLLVVGNSYAVCERERHGVIFVTTDPMTVSTIVLPANLLVESRDYSANELIYSSGWVSGNPSSIRITNCGRNYVVGWFYLNDPQTSLSGGEIAPTNITGLGVKVTTKGQAGPYDDPQVVNNGWKNGDGGGDHGLNSQYLVELYSLGGPIASGTLTFGSPLAQVEFRDKQSHSSSDGDVASQVVLTNTHVVIKAMGCTADTSAIRFPFGAMNLNQFAGVTTVNGAPDQTVRLACEPGTNVKLSVTAEAVPGGIADNSVIALTGNGTEGVASGVGVQLGLKSRSYDSGESGLPLNQDVVLFTSQREDINLTGSSLLSGGSAEQETLIFSARYYKISDKVIPGTANATATLNLTYN